MSKVGHVGTQNLYLEMYEALMQESLRSDQSTMKKLRKTTYFSHFFKYHHLKPLFCLFLGVHKSDLKKSFTTASDISRYKFWVPTWPTFDT